MAHIAVMDSGVGGISVLREMIKIMPNENFLYFGDSANAPYGTKSTEGVRCLVEGHVARFLEDGAKAIAIACNTATSAAVAGLRVRYPDVPLVGIEPALKPAALEHKGKRVLVMATPMTIREKKFHHLLDKYKDEATIIPLSCPGLMEYVEEGKSKSPEVIEFLTELLAPFIGRGIEAVVLGCTHYPFVRDAISEVLGEGVTIYDGGAGTARELKRRIEVAGLSADCDVVGTVVIENSDPDEKRIELCKQLLYA